jgi:hypothetical protein
MSRQSDEPNKPPHQRYVHFCKVRSGSLKLDLIREMMMDDDSDDYEPEFHEEEDERSHIGSVPS